MNKFGLYPLNWLNINNDWYNANHSLFWKLNNVKTVSDRQDKQTIKGQLQNVKTVANCQDICKKKQCRLLGQLQTVTNHWNMFVLVYSIRWSLNHFLMGTDSYKPLEHVCSCLFNQMITQPLPNGGCHHNGVPLGQIPW